MSKLNYIVLDLEWNQSYNPKEVELSNEIIEIGAYKLDENLNIIDYFHALIKPNILKKIHFKVNKITNINFKMLSDKHDFVTIFKKFLNWCGQDFIMFTWSNSDILVLKSNLLFYNLKYNFLKNNIDMQKLYAYISEKTYNQYSLEKIIEKLEIYQDRPLHRALNDAYYSSLILKSLKKLNFSHYIKEFSCGLTPKVKIKKIPQTKFVESVVSENINISYNNKREIFDNVYVNSLVCPMCNKKLNKTINWIRDKKFSFICLGFCENDGNVFSKINLKNSKNLGYIKKTTALSNSKTAGYIKFKKRNQDKFNFKN